MSTKVPNGCRLDEYDFDEWRDVAREVRPDWTDEDFARAWAGFVAYLEQRRKH